ncbi:MULTISPECIES: hypothetical protein [Streptomycetaceae]|uniref:hypothetical protein n=1 Tax=Streptomycetaceae TaxID=2062 RepID=UPI0011610192|nr:hypothetical protein [Streptomyces sp. CB02056]
MSDTHVFPADLLDLQRRWYAAEAAWVADPTEETRGVFAAVGAELYAHPHWGGVGNQYEAFMALKKAGRPDAAASAA